MRVGHRKCPSKNADKTRHRSLGSGHDVGSFSSQGRTFPLTSISSHPTTNNFVMLRLTVLAARPLSLGKSATVTLRPVARNFSSFGTKTTTNYFSAASSRSRVSPSSFWSRCSRTFMTDSSAVTARPTQVEAWKKYAVTAVSSHRVLERFEKCLHHTWFRLPSPERSSPLTCF